MTVEPASKRGSRRPVARGPRALRGLIGVFALSGLNLLGSFFVLMAIGGIAPWTRWQFVGLFGFMEIATALALLVAPNAWALPVRAAQQRVLLCADVMLVPRWGALAKLAAGLLLLGAAASQTGLGEGALLLPVVAAAVALLIVALSVLVARVGVARPDLDVCQVVLKRPGRQELVLPGISLGAIAVQFLLNITIVPLVKVAPPAILFGPELGPPLAVAAAAVLAAALAAALALLAWRGHVAWRAPAGLDVEPEPDVI